MIREPAHRIKNNWLHRLHASRFPMATTYQWLSYQFDASCFHCLWLSLLVASNAKDAFILVNTSELQWILMASMPVHFHANRFHSLPYRSIPITSMLVSMLLSSILVASNRLQTSRPHASTDFASSNFASNFASNFIVV